MTDTKTAVGIEVTDGAYRVTGGVPLVRISKVESDKGEPTAYRIEERIDAPETYDLCRCGQCATKPFADPDGCKDFDDAAAVPPGTYAERAKALADTPDITIHDDRSICSHAGFCADRATNVWKAAKVVGEDAELRTKIMGMIALCPSGALEYKVNGETVEPELPTQIAVENNACLRVTGGIPITLPDGTALETRNRVSLCRCGHSNNKPLCDGSHKEAGFVG